MKHTLLLSICLLFAPLIITAGDAEGGWVFSNREFSEILEEQDPDLVVTGSLQSIRKGNHSSGPFQSRSAMYSVRSSQGSVPKLVKDAVDAFRKDKLSSAFSESTGSQETGFVEHAWSYHHQASGVAGTLTIWFPNTGDMPMKMIVVITEWKPTEGVQHGE